MTRSSSTWRRSVRHRRCGRVATIPVLAGQGKNSRCAASVVPNRSNRGRVAAPEAHQVHAPPDQAGSGGAPFEITAELARPQVLGDLLPILVDVAAFEGEGIDEFVEERAFLLPQDERVLTRSLLRWRLAMWEVVVTDPGRTVTLRATRTGDQVVAAERTASQCLRQGQYLLARLVATGSQQQILVAVLGVELGDRESLIALLDSDPGAQETACWIGTAVAPPRLTNRVGEDTLALPLCAPSGIDPQEIDHRTPRRAVQRC
jgi:hypothetical protein